MFKTILTIEDDLLTQQLNEIMINEVGLCEKIITATSGQKALEFYEGLNNGEEPIVNKPQLILLDIHLPVMGAWDFLDHFEAKYPQYAKDLPIFILTSSVNPADKIKVIKDPRVICLFEKPLTYKQIENMKQLLTPNTLEP